MFATKSIKTCYNKRGDKMLKKYKIPILFAIIAMIAFFLLFCSKVNSDLMWNFGYSYNTASGKLMYRDFNMVISPIYPAVTGLLMSIIGNNMLSFTLINTFYVMLVIYLAYKINPKIFILGIPFILLSCIANYNTFCILFTLLLIYLEKEKKNDYLIGFIIGLAFLTKINVGFLLAIPSLYYFKNLKKLLHRFIGFCIPNIITVIIFVLLGNLKNYISYVFLGAMDFVSNNFQFSWMTIVIPFLVAVLIYAFIKEKNVGYLYAIFFMGIIYPVMNEMHVIIATAPAIVMVINKFDNFLYKLRYIAILLIAVPLLGSIDNYTRTNYSHDNNLFKFRPIQSEYIKNRDDLYRFFDGNFDNVYFLLYDNYLYKFMLDLPINKYDVILFGNLGYKGTEKMINHLKTLDKDCSLVLDVTVTGAQFNWEVIKYVRDNYELNTLVGKFYIYKKVKTS